MSGYSGSEPNLRPSQATNLNGASFTQRLRNNLHLLLGNCKPATSGRLSINQFDSSIINMLRKNWFITSRVTGHDVWIRESYIFSVNLPGLYSSNFNTKYIFSLYVLCKQVYIKLSKNKNIYVFWRNKTFNKRINFMFKCNSVFWGDRLR